MLMLRFIPLWFCFIYSVQALEPFPGANRYELEQEEVSRYRLILSELEKNQGKAFSEQERRLQGELQRSIWELPADINLNEVLSHYLDQVQDQQLLFQCTGIDCGGSHLWANDIFNHPRLVSRQKDQAYFVALSKKAEQNYLTILYISMRGGRQPRVLVDELVTPETFIGKDVNPVDVRQTLANTSGWLAGFITQGNELDVQASQILIAELNNLAESVKERLYLVVHCYQGAHFEDTQECSDKLAQQLNQVLDSKIHVKGQGALTPSPTPDNQPALRFVFWPGR